MKIVRKESRNEIEVTGRFSDGSDRVETPVVRWYVDAVDDAGVFRQGLRFDHDPTGQELYELFGQPTDAVPTAKAALSEYMRLPYERWWMWRNIDAEADLRGSPANVRTALQAQVDAAWADLVNAAQAWRAAV